ncbi:hypothetical protein [Streptomyces sp. ICBB 8177]|uniref:hypothetical protein n=1 Tax=Streptomyces sp. ICBB 8177 TaxID=563922 RepID=UPI000D6752F3|nr:hypothetical protein [Streptomyces sp. ICBB 8177]PWI42527.1 hypothetical protein CK485_09280 [Streptomyces sp. ICBB 8177]
MDAVTGTRDVTATTTRTDAGTGAVGDTGSHTAVPDGGPLVLLTLALLLERPMDADELAATAAERAADSPIGALTPTSAQFAVALTRLLHAALTESHPERGRAAHALTARGREAFTTAVRDLLGADDTDRPPFHTAVGYLGALAPEAALAGLRERAAALRARAARIAAAERGSEGVPRLYVIENEYAGWMCRAELEWAQRTAAEIERGTLAWPAEADSSEADSPAADAPDARAPRPERPNPPVQEAREATETAAAGSFAPQAEVEAASLASAS